MQKSGFSLIELLIGLLIASFLTTVLYNMFHQTVTVSERLSVWIDDYSDILLMRSELERDIAGIVVVRTEQKSDNPKAAEPKDAAPKATAIAQEGNGQKEDENQGKAQFSVEVKDGKLIQLSMITTHALPRVDKPGSHLVRVRYFLEEDPQQKKLFRLMRKETVDSPTAQKQEKLPGNRAYPLIQRLTSLHITLHVRTFVTGDGAKPATMKKIKQWGSKQAADEIPVPEYIAFEGDYLSHNNKDTIPFSFLIKVPIATGLYEAKQQELRKKMAAEQRLKGQQAPAQPPQQPQVKVGT